MNWMLFTVFIFGAFGSEEENKIDGGESITNICDEVEENLKLPNECMVCDERFPVSFQFSCGHELCALCAASIIDGWVHEKCAKCRKPLPHDVLTEWLPLIKIYTIDLATDIPLEKLQYVFPLICCVSNLTTVTKCVEMGINVDTKGFDTFPLHLASQKDVVEYLLDKGASVNQVDDDGWTPIFMSCYRGDLPVVEYLITKGANGNQTTKNGVTPLILAILQNHTEIAKFLLRNDASSIETAKLFFKENKKFELQFEILHKLWKEIDQ